MMTNANNKKVSIFIIGGRKCGSTSLANLLGSHPDVSMSSIKEPNYFNNTPQKRKEHLQSYHELFDWKKPLQAEASTSYTSFPNCINDIPQAIYNYNSEAKIIYIIRKPLERIISHYRMSYERGDLSGSINEAINTHPLLLTCTKYYSQIKPYIDLYGRENILILNTSELSDDKTLNTLQSFLELKNSFDHNVAIDNTAIADHRMPRSMDRLLNSRFWEILRLLFPSSFIKKMKTRLYENRNHGLTTDFNNESLQLIHSELTSEIKNISKLIDFDVEDWL